MKNNTLYYLFSLLFLLSLSFQLLEAGTAHPKDRIPSPEKCIGKVKPGFVVSLNCGVCRGKKMKGASNTCPGLKKKKLRKKIRRLEEKDYTCEPKTIYGYRVNSGYGSGQWYTDSVNEEDLSEDLDYNSERHINVHLCER